LSAIGGRSALKFYLVTDADPANVIYGMSHNFTYNTALSGTPYGTKGFVVVRKGGDAVVLKDGQAQQSPGWPTVLAYQNGVGMTPGGTVNNIGTEPGTVLTQ